MWLRITTPAMRSSTSSAGCLGLYAVPTRRRPIHRYSANMSKCEGRSQRTRTRGDILPNRVCDGCQENPAERARKSTESICACALVISDARGVSALTDRKLASDLKMSTRTLRRQVGSRDKLFRAVVEHHIGALTVDEAESECWEDAVQRRCRNLYELLISHARIAALMVDSDIGPYSRSLRRGVQYSQQIRSPRTMSRLTGTVPCNGSATFRCREGA